MKAIENATKETLLHMAATPCKYLHKLYQIHGKNRTFRHKTFVTSIILSSFFLQCGMQCTLSPASVFYSTPKTSWYSSENSDSYVFESIFLCVKFLGNSPSPKKISIFRICGNAQVFSWIVGSIHGTGVPLILTTLDIIGHIV